MLKNKNLVVTGSSRGIGKAVISVCVKYGANVWACMRQPSIETEKEFSGLEKEYGVEINPVYFDFSDESAVEAGAKEILSYKLRIDGIVNNVGITGESKLFSMTSIQSIRDVFEVNFFMPMLFTQKLLRNMIRNKNGAIVNVSSVAALDGEPAQFGYVSSKAAVAGATKKLASELSSFGIRVNAVAPGITDTDMISDMQELLKEETLHKTIMQRLAEPEEIAETIAFLLSEKSSYITGQVLRVDGGGK